jgi:hypothetical protein
VRSCLIEACDDNWQQRFLSIVIGFIGPLSGHAYNDLLNYTFYPYVYGRCAPVFLCLRRPRDEAPHRAIVRIAQEGRSAQ